jgi:hypothetical protein
MKFKQKNLQYSGRYNNAGILTIDDKKYHIVQYQEYSGTSEYFKGYSLAWAWSSKDGEASELIKNPKILEFLKTIKDGK